MMYFSMVVSYFEFGYGQRLRQVICGFSLFATCGEILRFLNVPYGGVLCGYSLCSLWLSLFVLQSRLKLITESDKIRPARPGDVVGQGNESRVVVILAMVVFRILKGIIHEHVIAFGDIYLRFHLNALGSVAPSGYVCSCILMSN